MPVQRIDKYERSPLLSREEIAGAIDMVIARLDKNMQRFSKNQFPGPHTENMIYPAILNTHWINGFWTGMHWLAYEITGDTKYRAAAEEQLDSYLWRFENNQVDTHDLGFLYSLSCVAAHKLTGNTYAREYALKAADCLATRNTKPGLIRQFISRQGEVRVIIDCMMNIPLLFWASQETGNGYYGEIAYSHAWNSVDYFVRKDDSIIQACYFDPTTGDFIRAATGQGYSNEGCWSRGQAWGIYGFPISYKYTADRQFLETARRLSHYFLAHLPEDGVCAWDHVFTENNVQRDSSAAAIAVCGMLELAKSMEDSDPDKHYFTNGSLHILESLIKNYMSIDRPEAEGFLLHGVYSLPDNHGVDECTIWGDYFFFEALVRLTRDWDMYW
ncbi:glycoside hydrolase family 88 protein [Paenibacillus silviterrae]|uniref:glycoside hydrolase family 88 protein n=1 Tax=Paenibacillus silviterrae TaxID=3242194 RepID=UPI0025436118|nr:glycoside hydrolase family 88 protein [Paenibacillus chinjuensis]